MSWWRLILTASLLALSDGVRIQICWTREGVQQYGIGSPLIVQLGDRIFFNCTRNPDFYAITRLADIRQYESCDCTAAGLSCEESSLLASRCTSDPALPEVTIDINKPGASLGSVLDYVPGETYYFTSFPLIFNANGFFVSAGAGGACEPSIKGPGLKMALYVSDQPIATVPPPTTISTARPTTIRPTTIRPTTIRPTTISTAQPATISTSSSNNSASNSAGTQSPPTLCSPDSQSVCEEATTNSTNTPLLDFFDYVIISSTGGGGLLALIVVVPMVCCCVCSYKRRKRRKRLMNDSADKDASADWDLEAQSVGAESIISDSVEEDDSVKEGEEKEKEDDILTLKRGLMDLLCMNQKASVNSSRIAKTMTAQTARQSTLETETEDMQYTQSAQAIMQAEMPQSTLETETETEEVQYTQSAQTIMQVGIPQSTLETEDIQYTQSAQAIMQAGMPQSTLETEEAYEYSAAYENTPAEISQSSLGTMETAEDGLPRAHYQHPPNWNLPARMSQIASMGMDFAGTKQDATYQYQDEAQPGMPAKRSRSILLSHSDTETRAKKGLNVRFPSPSDLEDHAAQMGKTPKSLRKKNTKAPKSKGLFAN